MTRRRASIAVAAALVTCAVAACVGAPAALAVPDLVAWINAICTTYAEQVEELAAPSFTPGSATAADLGAEAIRLVHY
jgi:hypothetical protein